MNSHKNKKRNVSAQVRMCLNSSTVQTKLNTFIYLANQQIKYLKNWTEYKKYEIVASCLTDLLIGNGLCNQVVLKLMVSNLFIY